MKRRQSPPPDASAAEWYVALDAGSPDEIAAARFAAWLDRAAESETDLERCEATVEIARRLADDPELRWAYDEAKALSTGIRLRRSFASEILERLSRPRLAWASVAIVLIGVVAAVIVGVGRAPSGDTPMTPIASEAQTSSRAAEILALAQASNPAIMLPGRVVVDANSVVVLPFLESENDAAADGRVAAELQRDLVEALRAVPGLYVIAGRSVSPYAPLEMRASEIGAQLGARAVLNADVALAAGGVLVTARLFDAATDSLLWEASYEQPLGELRSIQVEILDGVAGALVDPDLRARSARGFAQAKAPNVLATSVVDAAFQ